MLFGVFRLTVPVLAMLMLLRTADAQIVVTAPREGALVCPRTEVVGRLERQAKSAKIEELWIILHPKVVDDCWIQNVVSVKPDGTWSGFVNFGKPTQEHDNLPYEFKVVTLSARPKIGKTSCWPTGRLVSDLVTVKRRPNKECK